MKRKLASNSGRPGTIGSRTIILSYPDGTTVTVARSAARRSRVLQQYLNARQGVDDGACCLPRETVLAWLACLEAVAWRDSIVALGGGPTTGYRNRQDQRILEQLKAADFMNDVEAVEIVSETAGAWLFPIDHIDAKYRAFPRRVGPTSDQIEGMRGLSEALLIRVLRDSPASLDCQLSSLPFDFYEAILHASFPTIDADRALHLSEREFALAEHFESLMPVLAFLLRKLKNFSFESIATTYTHFSASPRITTPETVGTLLGCLTGVTRLGLSGNPGLFLRVQHRAIPYRQRRQQGWQDPLEGVGLPIPDGAEVLGPRIAALTALRELDLSKCRLNPVGATALGPHLECLGTVELLDLKGNELHDAGAVALAPYLVGMGSLQRIALSDNKLTSVGVTALKPVFEGVKAMLQIDVSSNELGPPPHLVRHFASGPSDAGDTVAVTAVASMAGAALASANKLQQLHLAECGLNWQGLSTLVGELASLGAISFLDLAGNRADSFGSGGADALGQRLTGMTRLHFLGVSRMRITDSCVQALVPHLARLTALRRLELADNDFGKPGLDALGDQLTTLRELQSLDVKGVLHRIDSVRAVEVGALEQKLRCSVLT